MKISFINIVSCTALAMLSVFDIFVAYRSGNDGDSLNGFLLGMGIYVMPITWLVLVLIRFPGRQLPLWLAWIVIGIGIYVHATAYGDPSLGIVYMVNLVSYWVCAFCTAFSLMFRKTSE
jgi:hypothetical protein